MAELSPSSSSKEGDVMLEPAQVSFKKPWFTRQKIVLIAFVALGLLLLTIGIVLIAVAHSRFHCSKSASPAPRRSDSAFCKPSDEAIRVGFGKFLDRVQEKFYELHPHRSPQHPELATYNDFGVSFVQRTFTAYDPTPSSIKKVTDEAWRMLDELNEKAIELAKLTSRERKTLDQVRHLLKNVFQVPYDVIYYTGEWMLGPNYFCRQPICYLGDDIKNALQFLKPSDLAGVDLLEKKLQSHKEAVYQYISNVRMGVRRGMVRNIETCKAGIDSLTRKYLSIVRYNATGVLQEKFVQQTLSKDYYSNITSAMEKEWKKTHNNMNVSESVKQYFVENLGKPIAELFRYLKEEHLRHCVPSSVSSGLASLPLKYVYWDGKRNASSPTDPTLPLTGDKLDGKKSYALLMPYFTTNDMTPNEVYDLGAKMLNKLYPMAVKVAREVTGEKDNATAVKRFREILNSSDSYFASSIPANESDENAYRKCSDLEGAKKYCPVRWDGMKKWFAEARKVMSMLAPKTIHLFFFTGPKQTTPNCPVDLNMNFNPSRAAQGYRNSDKMCSKTALYSIPFFLERMGPKYNEWSVNAHEARPGHHTQVQGGIEHFQDSCGGSMAWLDEQMLYLAFVEGWALYAENPLIAEDTDTYDREPMQKYGMLKWQIWRALRLMVDTGLHYKGMSRDEALKYFDEKAWDGTDYAQKEVTRYQGSPGQATSYMIGQQGIVRSREYATKQLGNKFDLRDFHYQVLKQGNSPLGYLTDHIKRYVACKKDSTKAGCDEILSPPRPHQEARTEQKRQSPFVVQHPDKWHYV